MPSRVKEKRVVIMGAVRRLVRPSANGRVMAILFVREGARVLCADPIGERARRQLG